jgi:alpha-tubulin suppressor-like RCC1 family protein
MDRRKFLKFAGIAGAAELFLGNLHPALAQTWKKLGGVAITSRTRFRQRFAGQKAPTIAAGKNHSISLKPDGLVFGSGYNNDGQLGLNTTADRSTFITAMGISNMVAVACGYFHSIALRSDGFVFGSGNNGTTREGSSSSCRT